MTVSLLPKNWPVGFRTAIAPLLAGAVMFGLTLWAWYLVDRAEINRLEAHFNDRVVRIENTVKVRLMAYEQMLRAGVALFNTSEQIGRYEWRTFVESLNVEDNYPGLLGIGFAKSVEPADKSAYVQGIQAAGFPDFRIWPEGERDSYSTIIYLEPFNDRNQRAFGYDMLSEPTRRAAMERARQTNSAAMSGKITLVQETDVDVQAGFLVYLPVYQAGRSLTTTATRSSALRGWIYSPFRMKDFIEATLLQFEHEQLQTGIAIYDGTADTEEALMFRNDTTAVSPLFSKQLSFKNAGRVWTMDFTSLPEFDAGLNQSSSRIILLSGLVITLLIMIQVWLLGNTRNRALALAHDISGALGEREAHLRGIMDNMSEGVTTIDEAGNVTSINQAVTQILGYHPEDLLGRNVNSLMPEPDHGRHDTYIQNYLRTGQGKILGIGAREVTARRKDGSELPVELTINVMQSRGRSGFIGVIRDISERKAAEWEIDRSRKLLQAILDNMADGIVACDAEGTLSLFNPATRKLHGLPLQSLSPESWAKYFSLYMPDGETLMPTSEIPLIRALKGEEVHNVEMVIEQVGGKKLRIFANGQAMYDKRGEKIGAVVSMRDGTEQFEIQRALRESEERFRKAFQSAGHGIAMVGLDGRFLDANTKLCEMLGEDRETLLTCDFQAFTHPDDLDEDIAFKRQLMAGEIESYQMEKRYVRKDGSVFPAILSVGLVQSENQAPLHFVSQIADISELRESEAKFLQAQKMETVGNLTGGIAHDFNNILAIILGNLQLIERRLADQPKLAKFTATAIEATTRGADLTRQLLAFSRRQELEPKVLDANEFVTNMENILRRTLGNHIKIQTNLATNLGRIKADPAQLESAILNLAINARDAMPEGGQLLIETSNETFDAAYAERYADAQPGPHVCISVTDSGTGIPADKIKSIFQPFFTTKEVGKGTGLGLSMVFGFVRQSGGHINVYSEVGQGTRFRLCLPHTDDQPARAGNNSFPDAPLQTGSGTILLIEDEAQVRETTALLLEDLGYTVIAAADGPSALQSLEVQPDVDLLFTDMVMPGGMNGHQLAEAVHQRLPDLPVLLTSGYPRDAFAEGRKFPLLNKPYTNQGLAQAIHLALDTKQSQEETR